MRNWLIPYDRDFAGVSVTSPSTSAARSGFRAMDVSSCEVDRVAFGERRAQGRSGNPSPQATCLGGCSADRSDANGQRRRALGGGMHECTGTRVVALIVLVLRGRE